MSAANIKVFCRFRPFNKQEQQNKAQKIHRIAASKQLIIKDPNRSQEISFMFDKVFDCDSTQDQVYQNVGSPVLGNILDGFNGTIMAYGQTSSGKTHTMQGHDINDKEIKGLIPRIIENLFTAIEKSTENLQFKLKVSIFELYMQKIRDLLDVSKNDLKIRENKQMGPYVEHLTEVYISDKVQFYKLIHLGQKNRATCMTNMNALSSRSHMIFLLNLNQLNLDTSQAKTSKLFLIDLAGSEKVSKTGAEGKVLDQAKKINLSLTSLGMVIKSLSENSTHIPYRDSKLTRVIKDSLGGNAKTTLIVTCSPHEMHVSETVSTLRFGENAQKIKNKPKINRELTIPELQKIIEDLEAKIEEKTDWIKILENYIKNELNSQLPKMEKKIQVPKPTKDKQPNIQQPDNHEQQPPQSPKDRNQPDAEQQVPPPTTSTSPFPFPDPFSSQQISSLQAELDSYKQNMQMQLTKFYNLKKEYNLLTENLKQVIEENICYQEKEKEYASQVEQDHQQFLECVRLNCGLVFAEILDACSGCHSNTNCADKIKAIIQTKGKSVLCTDSPLQLFENWRQQKQSLRPDNTTTTSKIESLTTSKTSSPQFQPNFLGTLPSLPTSPRSKRQSQKCTAQQNKKIVEMQQKLDGLYNEYQHMLSLQTNWKVECQLYQRKLKIKEEKITELRNMLEDMQEQIQMMDQDQNQTMSVNTKIVKPLKGGFLFR